MIPELGFYTCLCKNWSHTFSCFAGFSAPALQVELMTVHAKWLSPDGGFAAIKPLI
jgi:hypothetical protein